MNTNSLFIKSSRCGGGSCVEVAFPENGEVIVKDSKNPTQQPLIFTAKEWTDFLEGATLGEFTYPDNSK